MSGPRRHLLTYLDDLARLGNHELYRWKDGARWRSRSYRDLHGGALGAASLLVETGVQRGDTVMLQGPEDADWIEAFFGVLRAGAVAVPLSTDTPAEFRQKVVKKADVKWFIAPPWLESPDGCAPIRMSSWPRCSTATLPPLDPDLDDRAEIIFTSGTTGDPKGVILTHRNLIADFAPIEHRFGRYRRYVRLGGPTRVLVTIPLSHMFGQAVAIFLLPFMGCSVVLVPPRPLDVMAAARRMNAWALVTVPRLLDLLAQAVNRELRTLGRLETVASRAAAADSYPLLVRAAVARRVHGLFGWRFWALVSGGAALGNDIRAFWERFGFLVAEGYGLTETAPIVAVSNPFSRLPGVGRPLSDQELKIGADGEVLVRGRNVTPGYLGGLDAERFVDGWFHTGDIGELDDEGRLVIRGRAADVIVTPEGENVFPSDVEDALRQIEGVRDACVVGVPGHAGDEVHAALVLADPSMELKAVERANKILQPKQRIRSYSVWPETDLPRTCTGKVQTSVVRSSVMRHRAERLSRITRDIPEDQLRLLVAQHARVDPRSINEGTTLTEALGLGSLDLVELTIAIEDRLGVSLDDDLSGTSTFADLRERVAAARSSQIMIGQAEPARFPEKRTTALDAAGGPQGAAPRHSTHGARNTKGNWSGSLRMPRWAARFPAHHIRRAIEETIIVRLVHTYARPEVEGRHHIERVQPPLLIVSNHRSHVDAALIKTCVPRAIRGRLAPGMTTRWERLFFGEETGTFKRYIGEWIESRMIQLLFHAWPIPRTAGFRQSLMYAGELADSGFSILLFPEGRHVPAAVMGPFRPGSGILARELRLPVVPVYLEGSDQIIREGEPWYRFHHGRARVVFGTPFEVDPEVSTEDAAHQLQTAIMALAPETLRVDPDLPPEESLDRCEEPSTCRP